MSAVFLAASSQYLTNTSLPVTTYPFTVGFWFWTSTTAANYCLWDLSNPANNNYFNINANSVNSLTIEVNAAGADQDGIISTALTANVWAYICGRFISATNRRLTILQNTGSVSNAQNTANAAPSGVTTMTIGRFAEGGSTGNYTDGKFAEFFVANADIQADGAQLQDALLRQLAFNGPFSISSLAGSIVDYRSFYSSVEADKPGEVYYGGKGKQTWVNNNGVKLGPHPPLLPTYRRPDDAQSLLVI